MKTTLFAACAIAGLISAPAMAQVSAGAGVGAKATATPPAATASPSMPSTSMPSTSMPSSKMPSTAMPTTSAATDTPPAADPAATAATGTATNTAATASDLKMGAAVTDTTGAELGTISKVTKGKTDAETMVTLKANGKTKTVPASSLGLSGGALVSSQTKADIWGPM